MNVADAMTPRDELVTVELPGTRDDVLTYLQDYGFSSVPVTKAVDGVDVYRGIVSRDSLIERPDEDQLALLTREVETVTPDTDLLDAAAHMVDNETRRVPVVDPTDNDELDGIITVTDVVHAIAREQIDGETAVDSGEITNFDISVREAVILLLLFASQVVIEFGAIVTMTESGAEEFSIAMLHVYTVLYVAISVVLFYRRREALVDIFQTTAATARESVTGTTPADHSD